jgi:hypothetical protein
VSAEVGIDRAYVCEVGAGGRKCRSVCILAMHLMKEIMLGELI